MSSNNRFYSKLDLRRNFKDQTYQRGYQYYQQGRVLTAEIFENTEHSDRLRIYGEVEGSGTNEYQVTADIQLPSPRNRSSKCQLEGDCTCPVSFDCKHVVAILFHMLDQGDNKTTPYELLRSKASNAMPIATTAEQFSLWSDKLIRAQEYKKPASTELIVYIMKTQQYRSGHILSIKPMLTRILKKGGYGVTKRYSGTGTVAERATTDEDRRLLALLGSMTVSSVHFDYEFDLCFQQANELFTELLQTQRLFWNNISNTPLALGSTNTLELAWRIEENGCQKLEYSVEGISDKQDLTLLPFASPWYYNKSNNTCGQIQNDIASKLLFPMLDLPALEPTAVETAQQQLKKLQPNKNAFPLPATLKKGLAPKAMLQKVIVRLLGAKVAEKSHYYSFSHEEDVLLPFAELAFYYNDQLTTLAEHKTIITQYKNNKIIELKRDLTWEQSCVDKLIALDITPMLLNKDYILNDAVEFSFLFESQEDDEELLLTKVNELKQLANENGWQVNIDESFPMQIVDEIDEWYSDIEEGARGIDWFSLTLGVIVKGEKVNLLPLLVDLIKNRFHNLDTNAIAALPDDTDCTLKLQNGHFITVPFARIRNILLVLCELFDSKALDENGALELSHLQAGLLLEIKKAMSATQMRWFGGERLLAFAEKLTHFKGIKTVNPAKTLKATLRPKQQEALNWLK
jgi:hypothetical protein